MTTAQKHGSSLFKDAYVLECNKKDVPMLSDILSPSLELKKQLYIDVQKLKREALWGPIMAGLRDNADLKEIHIFSNVLAGGDAIADENALANAYSIFNKNSELLYYIQYGQQEEINPHAFKISNTLLS